MDDDAGATWRVSKRAIELQVGIGSDRARQGKARRGEAIRHEEQGSMHCESLLGMAGMQVCACDIKFLWVNYADAPSCVVSSARGT